MNKLSPAQVGGIVRAILGAVGGVLIAAGWIDETMWLEASGALVTLTMIGWSLYSNTVVAQTKSVASSPEVKSIVTTQALAYASDNPKVVPQ